MQTLPPIGSLVRIRDNGPESARLAIVTRHLKRRRDGLLWVETLGPLGPEDMFVYYMELVDAAPQA